MLPATCCPARLLRPSAIFTTIVFLLCTVSQAYGQAAAIFSGVQAVLPTGTLNTAYGVAVDAAGNVYVANSGLSQVLKETLNADGTYTESTIGSGLYSPGALALDTAGNLYIADTDNGRVLKETPSGGTYTQTIVTSGLSTPYGVAVDNSGNVYVADTGNARILEETPYGIGYTQTAILSSLTASSLAVDGAGNLYICDSTNHQVVKETLSGGTYTQSTIATGISTPSGIAVDRNGIVFVADNDTASVSRILEEIPVSGGTWQQYVIDSGAVSSHYGIGVDANDTVYWTNNVTSQVHKTSLAAAAMGTRYVGATAASVPLTFRFTAAGSIQSPLVLTQGSASLDFADAGTGSCTTNGSSHTYAEGDTCTVDVTFTAKSPGARYGAVELADAAGDTIATAYLSGTGLGLQISFPPGTRSKLSLPNITNPYAIAMDHAGNLYVANAVSAYDPGNAVVKETWNGTAYTQTVVATGFAYPVGVAVDGAGNVYVADQDSFKVYKETRTGSAYTQSAVDTNLGTVEGVAVDASGNIYISSLARGVVKEVPAQGAYLRQYIASSIQGPEGIAVDGEGNVFVVDVSSSQLYELSPGPAGYTKTQIASISSGHGAAVDAVGNVYIAAGFGTSSQVLKETYSGGSFTQTVAVSGLDGVLGVAVDSSGNLYFCSDSANAVWQLDTIDPPSLSFAPTTFGSASADSPKSLTVENSGNVSASFPVPGTGSNPTTPTSFAIDSSGASACPHVTSATPAGTLTAGSTCQLSISFVPASVGAITGSVVLTEGVNPTSVNRSTQTIQLSGTGLQATPTLAVTLSATSITTADAMTVNVTVQRAAAGAAPTGTATLSGGGYTAPAATLTSGSASFQVPAGSLALGTDTLTVSYSGDANYSAITGTASVSVTVAPATPAFSLAGTALSVARGATSGNTSTITLTPSGGFTGAVNLACTVTTSITNPNDPPTCTVTSPVTISGTAQATSTLTVKTTAATTATLHNPLEKFLLSGGATLAMVFFFGIPARRKAWRGVLTVIAILLIGSAIGCGGGGNGSAGNQGGGSGSGNPGTTPGTYTVTVTGTDAATGKITATTTVTVTVS
ncbi:MAG TPA: Ig-like domain repeat protein [Acidobacteriaceae bacterium]|nr:Ig-like domain repeat protein [Acidobacteriaceae bacterium]